MICFVDCETSNLDERTGHLLEVALVVTDDDLLMLSAKTTLVRPVGVEVEALVLDDVVRDMHTKNGLLAELPYAPRRYEAEDVLVAFVREQLGDGAKKTPLAGNTVGFDRRWLRHHMEPLDAMFHYRSIDVSSVNELAARWARPLWEARPRDGAGAHRAAADARQSIDLLRYYRDANFIGGVRA